MDMEFLKQHKYRAPGIINSNCSRTAGPPLLDRRDQTGFRTDFKVLKSNHAGFNHRFAFANCVVAGYSTSTSSMMTMRPGMVVGVGAMSCQRTNFLVLFHLCRYLSGHLVYIAPMDFEMRAVPWVG